jgi:hypothetical protein
MPGKTTPVCSIPIPKLLRELLPGVVNVWPLKIPFCVRFLYRFRNAIVLHDSQKPCLRLMDGLEFLND